tara:strand:- start:242 stop:427 length:186 start_codon:yes stop_codon:yes gene_type:complete
MNIEKPELEKTITLSDNTTMTVQMNKKLADKIKQAYNIEIIEDSHIERFFEDILEDAISRS